MIFINNNCKKFNINNNNCNYNNNNINRINYSIVIISTIVMEKEKVV